MEPDMDQRDQREQREPLEQRKLLEQRELLEQRTLVFIACTAIAAVLALFAFIMSTVAWENISALQMRDQALTQRVALLVQHVAALEEWRAFVVELAADHRQKLGAYPFDGLVTAPNKKNSRKGKAP